MSLPLRGLASLATASVLLLSVAACGDDDKGDSAGSDQPTNSSQRPAATPTDTPTSASSEPTTAPSSTEGTVAPPAQGLAAHLLPAEALPAVGTGTWTVSETGSDDGEPFGECGRFSLVDVGATETVVREFDAGEGVSAEQLVAEFPDKKSAWRVHQVLKSWHKECASNPDVAKVSPLSNVEAPSGVAQSYLVTGKDPQEFEGVAINRVGTLISIALIDVEGQAWPSDDPLAATAKAAAPLL
ncbi:hypothetical protein ACLM5J_13635 [Nocardioides sp. Bht2]|uniref:hypothetical protein n=1 Tax=Nocardioides sp. Bht2 TaxID=3392297 RepID=UPI0039B6BD05